MKKNILIVTGSPRKGGNSDLLADAFKEGAIAAGHTADIFAAGRKQINGCIACDTCFSKGSACSFDDGFNELAPMLEKADALVLAVPLYWLTFPAQIKAAIDKLYSFSLAGKPLKIKECALFVCAETDDDTDFEGIIRTHQLICSYKGWKDLGCLTVKEVNGKGDILKTDALERARDFASSM